MNMPTNLPTLSGGKQETGSNKVCAEQAVNWLVSGRLDLGDETDHPSCVQPVLNALAIHVNDALPDDERQRMWPIILRQPGTAHPEMEPILSIRLACFLAQKVIHLTRRQDRKKCEEAITSALAYCDNPCKETAYAAANAANAANAAANAAYAAANAAYAANAANAAANAAYAAANAANAAYAANAANAAYAANAANAANAATAAPSDRWDALIGILNDAQSECERLTNHAPQTCDLSRLERLAELVGKS
jgi:hypothetical protein